MSVATVLSENITNTHQEFQHNRRSDIVCTRLKEEDASKLDQMFNKKDCVIEVNPGKVLLPPLYEEMADKIRGMKVRPDDVWLASYPRAGSTWAQEMVWCIGNDLDFEKAKVLSQLRTPLLEMTIVLEHDNREWKNIFGNSVEKIETMPSPRFIKTHLTWDLLPAEIETIRPKIVYVARNPKDMCVSYYHHCRLFHDMTGSFEDFCELFLKDIPPLGPIWNHILGFWRRRHESNILLLKYEDMKRDQKGAIRKTADFLGKSLTDAQVDQLAEHLSFNNMKKNPALNFEPIIVEKNGSEFLQTSNLRFIRKGEIGDWKNHMSPEMAARFDAWFEEHFKGTGLSFD